MATKTKAATVPAPRLTLPLEGLVTELVPITQLRQHPQNPRAADPDLIAQSMRAHGQYRAIVVASDGTILAGNHTYQAALQLGYEEIWVHRLPIDGDSQQAVEIMLADNRTSDLSRYDEAVLAQLLSELDAEGVHAAAWEPGDMDRLIAKVAASAPAEFPEASVPGDLEHKCPRCGFEFNDQAG